MTCLSIYQQVSYPKHSQADNNINFLNAGQVK